MPDLSIIIVNYNSGQLLVECLKSIYKYISKINFEISVIDNNSTDKSCERIPCEFPQVNFILNDKNVGFTKATNQGLKLSKGRNILFLNPDTRFIDDSIEKMVNFLDGNPSVGVVGPMLLNSDMSWQITGYTFPSLFNILVESLFLDRLFPRSRFFGKHKMSYRNPNETCEVDWVMGACLMVKRALLDNLDESFFMYFEDTDLCYQIKQKGWKVFYLGEAAVIHYGGRGFEAYNAKKIVEYHKSLFYFFKKYFHSYKLQLLKIIIFLRSLVRLILGLCLYLFYKSIAIEKIKGYYKVLVMTKL